jgi:23S rRNA pseudouridine1911/1915/1917 synthase
MIVAKDDEAHRLLSEMFRGHQIERAYLALVRGGVAHDRFRIDAPLGRDRARIRVRAITGKEAATEVEVRERLPRSTLVEARPRTGRTHQIRVHLSSTGHPILGDRTYGGGGQEAAKLGLTRPFLHSWRIAFEHPITGERIEREDSLPQDLQLALEKARSL